MCQGRVMDDHQSRNRKNFFFDENRRVSSFVINITDPISNVVLLPQRDHSDVTVPSYNRPIDYALQHTDLSFHLHNIYVSLFSLSKSQCSDY